MPASTAPHHRQDLLDLEERLLDDRHAGGFGFLLSILPTELFALHNCSIILNPRYHSRHSIEDIPIFAFLDDTYPHRLHSDIKTSPFWKPEDIGAFQPAPNKISLLSLDDRIAALSQVPPLSWITEPSPDWLGTNAWADQIQALFKYFLLVWAFESKYSGWLPSPNYDHLRQILVLLKQTNHYQMMGIKYEDEEVRDVQKSVYEPGGNRALVFTSQDAHLVQTDCPPPPCFDSPGSQPSLNASHAAVLSNHTSSESLQSSSSDVAIPAIGTEIVYAIDEQEPAVVQAAGLVDERVQLPTPDTMDYSAPCETDCTLALLQRHKKLGAAVLSRLPALEGMTFLKLHHQQSGFLPLRLLIGTLNESAQPHLRGHNLWASFKIHDKDARTAPRMLVDAFRADNDEPIPEDKLKFETVLPDLSLIPVFSIHDGTKRTDMQFKALVKFYFILAANAKLHGFTQHLMPMNDTFVEQLRIACTRNHNPDVMDVDSDSRDGFRRKRRGVKVNSRMPSVSDAEFEGQVLLAEGTRRSSRRPKKQAEPVADDSDGPATATATPEHGSPVQKFAPRKLALGLVVKSDLRYSVTDVQHGTSNEFLDPGADLLSSDGESGDEIPTIIPLCARSLLKERDDMIITVQGHREVLKLWRDRKVVNKQEIGRLEWHLKRPSRASAAMADELVLRQQEASGIDMQIKIREGAVKGFKEARNRLEGEIRGLDSRWAETWEQMKWR